MDKRLLAVFAHPDDESFGPAGTLAHYVNKGVHVRLVTATRGEAGKNSLNSNEPLGVIRERELKKAAKIIGIEKLIFLGYVDKTLKDLNSEEPIQKILAVIDEFKPQVILTYGPTGISLHPDHITVHKWTTQAFQRSDYPKKLYYYTLPPDILYQRHPELTYDDGKITTIIDVDEYKNVKKAAIECHQSQSHSIMKVFNFAGGKKPIPSEENFVLAAHKLDNFYPLEIERDLFTGIF